MTATSAPARPARVRAQPVSPWRQLLSLARAELILLRRNKMQLVTAAILPLALPFVMLPLKDQGGLPPEAGARAVATFILFLLLFVVYYNLLCSYVARREELVLKRLRAGACPDWVVLAGTAAPAVVVALVQAVLLTVVSWLVLEISLPVNWPLLVLTVLFSCLVFVLLALLTVPITRTVEAAQITCLPFMSVLVLGSGIAIPLDVLPDWAQTLCQFIPSAAMADLTTLSWLGVLDGESFSLGEAWAEALPGLGVLAGWTLLSVLLVKRYLRWEPRA